MLFLIINKGEKKVYLLSGPKKNGVLIFGNDYLIEFDKSDNVKNKRLLHKNIIPIEFKNNEGKDAETMHNHLPKRAILLRQLILLIVPASSFF